MIDACILTKTLGGRWHRSYGVAPCPVCQPEGRKDQNALTLSNGRNGRLLANCKKSGCAFSDILAAAGVTRGRYRAPHPAMLVQGKSEQNQQAAQRAAWARRIWDAAQPIAGTPGETYLRARGITCHLPAALRFAPSCWHPSAKRFPALVAKVEGGDSFAVHRTFLRTDGQGKAKVGPAKMMLGQVTGGAVRFSQPGGPLVVAEGLETALSLASGLLSGPATIWAALSTSGVGGLRLPAKPGQLIVASDGDQAGHDAANTLAERAHALGWQVSLLPAPDGCDLNDILTMKGETA